MEKLSGKVVDVHCHVGLRGDVWPEWGMLSEKFVESFTAKVFLTYSRVPKNKFTDPVLKETTEQVLSETTVDKVVCLALDWVHDESGKPRPDLTNMYVSNDFVLELRKTVGDKVLLGASVHPYAPDFEDRVKKEVDRGAVLLKWLPSAQNIDLASPRAGQALRELAHLGPNGRALPLLLHTGAEYAVPPMDDHTPSLDFHRWTPWDAFWNRFRGSKKWRVPDVRKVQENVRVAVSEGTVIIFAHCGLPYFASRPLSGWLEHSDFTCVRTYLNENERLGEGGGGYYADLSACCTPFREGFFPKVRKLPDEHLLFGSDFPTPVFELSADAKEVWRDFRAVVGGDLERIVVPQDNLLDVNLKELRQAFPGHPMFTNFGNLWDRLAAVSSAVSEENP